MVNRSTLGFTNRTKAQSRTAFGTDATPIIPGRTKPLSAKEKLERLIAHQDSSGRKLMSKENYDKAKELLAAGRLKKRKPKTAKKSPSKK